MSRRKLKFSEDGAVESESLIRQTTPTQGFPKSASETRHDWLKATAPVADPPKKKHKQRRQEEKIEKLEQKSERLKDRSMDAENSLPKKKKVVRKRIYDEQKDKAKTKLIFETQLVPIGETKWNRKKSLPRRIAGSAVRMPMRKAATKAHAIVHSVEHENVGVKAAHRGEFLSESAYRAGRKTVRSAYRFHKNRPYRKAARLEMKSIKTEGKLSYRKAVQDMPEKKNAVSRFFQKRRIKRQYAAAFRDAKKSGKVAKGSAGIAGKLSRWANGIIRRNPLAIGKLAIFGLFVVLIMSLFSMCMSIVSGGSIFVGAVTYAADYEDIDDAEIAYGEWTVDLQIDLRNIERTHSGFDEYRYDVGEINHNPFELMAYLTAVHGGFTFTEIEPVLRELFHQQYQLSLVSEMEIRTRIEDGVEVQYEWHILNVTLQSTPMRLLLLARMDNDQWQHFNILMMSHGARQIVGNPFDRNWLPHVSSHYGYRIHPIHGDKRFHAGIDIALPTGTEILAGFDGIVTSVGYDADGWGNFVVIDNRAGIQALYAHCHAVLVSNGQRVSEGDVIATVGSTGASTGPHLHMEVIRHGRRLNPLFFVVTGYDGGSFAYGTHPPLTAEQFAILYAEARSHLGKPYVYGANGPNAFDCSSFVAWVYRVSGIYPLARTTAQGIFNQSIPIPMGALMPGDIVFFTRTYSTTDIVTHLGIYIGEGHLIHAGRPVNITSIHTPFWQTHFFSVGRLRW